MSTNQNNSNPPQNKPIIIKTTTTSSNGYINVPITSSTWNYNFNYNPFGYVPPDVDEAASGTKDDRDGCVCKKCKEFYPYAEPNQEDKTLICYSCRNGY